VATKISMPKLSDTMKEGRLIRWHKNEGDEVKPGDVLAEVETDKANMDLEAFDPGTLLKRLVQENEKVQVGAVMCVIGDKGENIDALLKETPAAEKKLAPARVVPEPAAVRPQAPVPPPPPAAVGAGVGEAFQEFL